MRPLCSSAEVLGLLVGLASRKVRGGTGLHIARIRMVPARSAAGWQIPDDRRRSLMEKFTRHEHTVRPHQRSAFPCTAHARTHHHSSPVHAGGMPAPNLQIKTIDKVIIGNSTKLRNDFVLSPKVLLNLSIYVVVIGT